MRYPIIKKDKTKKIDYTLIKRFPHNWPKFTNLAKGHFSVNLSLIKPSTVSYIPLGGLIIKMIKVQNTYRLEKNFRF